MRGAEEWRYTVAVVPAVSDLEAPVRPLWTGTGFRSMNDALAWLCLQTGRDGVLGPWWPGELLWGWPRLMDEPTGRRIEAVAPVVCNDVEIGYIYHLRSEGRRHGA